MQFQRHNGIGTHASFHAAWLMVFMFSISALAGGSSSVPSIGANEQSMHKRGLFGTVGHYLANNSYASLGYLRFQYIGGSNDLQAHGATAQTLAGGASVPNSGTSISNENTVGATIGIFIPKTAHHLSFEFGLAPPVKTDFQITGNAQKIGSNPATPAGQTLGGPIGSKIGTFKSLPPNFTLVLRPFTDTTFQPYIGAGAMWLHSYDQDVTNPRLKTAAKRLNSTEARLDLSQPWACVAKAGFDIQLPKSLFFKFDARYVGCATVDATLSLGKEKASGKSNGTVTTENDFESMLYQASFGINF